MPLITHAPRHLAEHWRARIPRDTRSGPQSLRPKHPGVLLVPAESACLLTGWVLLLLTNQDLNLLSKVGEGPLGILLRLQSIGVHLESQQANLGTIAVSHTQAVPFLSYQSCQRFCRLPCMPCLLAHTKVCGQQDPIQRALA